MTTHAVGTRPLLGFRVGVTAARRREEQVSLLERRGAEVTCASVVRTAPLTDDSGLLEATRQCVARPPDIVVATTGIGFRGWCEAADGWGLGEPLVTALRTATVLARGPKTVGAIRAAGLRESWVAPSETLELVTHLLERGVRGRRVVVQEHGENLDDIVRRLRAAGADVVVVSVYRCETVDGDQSVTRLLEMVVRAEVDALTFTSAPAAAAFLGAAELSGQGTNVLEMLRTDITVACVGPVTAAPFERCGIPTVQPERARLGAMVRELAVRLPMRRRGRQLTVAGRRVEVRGAAGRRTGGALACAPRGARRARGAPGRGVVAAAAPAAPSLGRGAQ